MPIKATIGGVDVSTYLKGLSASPGGDGVVGNGTLILDQQAGGLDLRPMMNATVHITFNAAGSGVAASGRLFGGVVGVRDTGAVGTTKLWALRCYDYNLLLHKIVRDASAAKAITLTAGTFAAQVIQLTSIIQLNGFGAVNTQIDATTGVASLYATMPAVTYEGGHPYGWYIQQLCNTAQSLNTALIPHFYMGTDTAFGVGATFGNPVLYVYNGAALPAIGLSFSDVVAGGRKGIYGTFRRTTDPTAMVQRRQAFFSDAHTIVTSQNATSQSTYPNPYINNGGTSNTGYWGAEVIEDSASSTFAEAQAALDRRNLVESSPVDTFEFETEERVQPGDMIGLGWSLEGIADDTPYRVAKVSTTIEGAEVVNSRLTVNSRRLGLFDDGQAVFAPPIEGDNVAPLPPADFSVLENYYDGDTGDANMIFLIDTSPSPDVVGYAIRGRVGHSHVDVDVETTMKPSLIFPSGLAYTLQAMAYDRNRNYSEGAPSVALTGTTAVPVYQNLVNPDFDAFDRLDSTLPYHWTRTVANGGTATWNAASHTGAACVKLSTTGTAGSSATILSSLVVVRGSTYGLIFWANVNTAGTNVTWQYDWYDNTQAFISSSSGTKTLTTSWARYTATATAPATAAFYKLSFKNNTLSRDVRVDTVTSTAQSPTDSIEDGAISGPKFASTVSLTAQTVDFGGTSKLTAGSGKVTIDPNGIKLDGTATGANNVDLYNEAGTRIGRLYSQGASGSGAINLDADYNGAGTTQIGISAVDAIALSTNTANELITMGSSGISIITTASNILVDTGISTAPILFRHGSVLLSGAALSTSATDGFVYLPTCAGKPTGTPTTQTGTIPRVWDSTNKIMWQYDGSWKAMESEGTAMPSSPYTGQRFYRSDLMQDVYYDGTRWLGPQKSIPFSHRNTTQPFSVNGDVVAEYRIRSGKTIWLEAWAMSTHVVTTNNGSNYWTVALLKASDASDITSKNTSGDAANTWVQQAEVTSFTGNPFTPASVAGFAVQVRKTVGAPGNIYLDHELIYREVYT